MAATTAANAAQNSTNYHQSSLPSSSSDSLTSTTSSIHISRSHATTPNKELFVDRGVYKEKNVSF
jgi:hypothetical protein